MKKFAIILMALVLVTGAAYADKLADMHGPEGYVPLSPAGSSRATGDDCTDPIVINMLPFSDFGQTTCGRLNTYEGICGSSYFNGEDIIYRLDLAATATLDITMDPLGTTWTGLAILDDCPDIGTCVAYDTGSSGIREIAGLELAAGTYFIIVDTWPTPDCIPEFNLTIDAAAPPQPGDTCDLAVEAVEGLNSCPGAEFWYVYTAPIDGCIWIDTCIEGQTVDTYLYVNSDCVPTLLDLNDDSGVCDYYSFASFLSIPVLAGDVLYIEWADTYSSAPFDWYLTVTDCVVSTESGSWDGIKSLYR